MMLRNEGRAVKIYDDLSNDDLIDLLIKKGFRPNSPEEHDRRTENLGPLQSTLRLRKMP